MRRTIDRRRTPSEDTDAHASLRRLLVRLGIDPADAQPEWHEETVAVEDVDGRPLGIEVRRTAALSNTRRHPRR